VALGTSFADRILALRSDDGSDVKVNYVPGTGPGDWGPTPPAYAPAVDPQWGRVTPFALASGSQFQPPPPPVITSVQYAQEVNQVEALGGTDSTVRTPDETAAARFWSDLPGTFTPPGHWNQITAVAAIRSKSNLGDSARAFALVDIALADAGIEAWDVKYTDNTVRPVTVIRDGAEGVNPLITADPTWTPLWDTPSFPSYISGHSTFSAAAAAVLTAIYGDHFAFTDPGDPTMALAPRHFSSFDAAAQEAGMSRIYGGIHFMSDNIEGLQLGSEVGQYVVQHELLPLDPGKS
jgi:membrane-associated phospholipid phosphatase